MKSYTYFISYRDYGNSIYIPIQSHKKLTDMEFQRYCKKAHNEISSEIFNLENTPFIGVDMCRLIRDKLCEEDVFFFKQDITAYDLERQDIIKYNYL